MVTPPPLKSKPACWMIELVGGVGFPESGAIGRLGGEGGAYGRVGGARRRPSQTGGERGERKNSFSQSSASAVTVTLCGYAVDLPIHPLDILVAKMTVEVCTRVGVRVSATPGAMKDESQPGGGTSPAHETSEAPTPRPKFMITDILAQHKPPTPAHSECSAPPTPTIEEPKDLSLTRPHPEDEDIDLEGDASHDEDDPDSHETGEDDFACVSVV